MAECSAMPSARATRATPQAPSGLGHSASVPIAAIALEQIPSIFGGTFWRATETWRGFEFTSGYGDTPDAAIAELDRLTAWRAQ